MSAFRIRRAVAAVAVTAASLAGTAAIATPAFAATPSKASVSFGNLVVSGSPDDNNMRFVRSGGGVRLTDTNAPITAGTGCVAQSANAVLCSGVENITANGGNGNDFIANSTTLTSNLGGGNGDDVLLGGSNNDQLTGNIGNDRANGGRGVDFCSAESVSSCE